MPSQSSEASPHRLKAFLRDQGSIGAAILAKDWSRTSLGPIEAWPSALETVLRLVLTTRHPIVFFWGPDLLQFYNETYTPILNGMPQESVGAPFLEFWGEVFEGVRPFYERAMSGEGTWANDLPLTLTRNGVSEATFWTFSYSPLFDDEGAIAGFLNIVNETTRAVADRAALAKANARLAEEYEKTRTALASQLAAEKRQRVLQRELSHRMKNSLAMVQAIVSQSVRYAASPHDAGQVIAARVQALGRAQDLLTRTSWEQTDIASVVDAALEPHRDGSDRIASSGAALTCVAEQGLGLALAIHELATNAVKYGALSSKIGRIEVDWWEEGDRFVFRWRETGEPISTSPQRKGFGSRLLERIVPGYFGGEGRIDLKPDGLAYRLDGTLRPD